MPVSHDFACFFVLATPLQKLAVNFEVNAAIEKCLRAMARYLLTISCSKRS